MQHLPADDQYSEEILQNSEIMDFDLSWKNQKDSISSVISYRLFFFYLGFLLQSFANHGTAGEGGGHFFNSLLPLPSASQTLSVSRAITAESSLLHIGSSWTQTGNLWFPSANH